MENDATSAITVNQDVREATWEERRVEMFSKVRNWSEKFIKRTAHPEGAFHDFRHFNNVVDAGRKYLKNVNDSDRGTDPLNFWEDLETYCKDNGLNQNFFSTNDLEIAMDL